jgi:hypothetical protein
MEIFEWFSDTDNYAVVRGRTKADRTALRFDSCVPRIEAVVQLEAVSDEREPLGDFPSTGVAFPKCLSTKACQALHSLLPKAGRIRKAEIDGEEFYLFWPDISVQCLDIEQSEIQRSPTGYQTLIMPVFTALVEQAGPIFLVPEFRTQILFVNDQFVALVQGARLRGLELRRKFGDEAEIVRVG